MNAFFFQIRGILSSQIQINFKAAKNIFSNFLQIFVELLTARYFYILKTFSSGVVGKKKMLAQHPSAEQQLSYKLMYSGCGTPQGHPGSVLSLINLE